jgi:competence protein ComEC
MAQGLSVIIMDAGQGDAALIVYPDDNLVLIDCGCKMNSNVVKTEIQKILNTYLSVVGNKLKALVLTHSDGDHYNLVDELIIQKGVTVGTLFFSGVAKDYVKISDWIQGKRGPKILDRFPLSGSYYETSNNDILSYSGPDGTIDALILAANVAGTKKKKDPNPKSVTIVLSYLDYSIFLMGDATEETENFILAWDNLHGTDGALTKLLQSAPRVVLKAGHHGSLTSSGQPWLDKLKPEVVFISSDTKSFAGTSLPRSTVIDHIMAGNTVVQVFPQQPEDGAHSYVQYNDKTKKHEAISTKLALCTTLHFLKFKPDGVKFTAYGTSWSYDIQQTGAVFVTPTCGWDNINTAP